MKTGHSPAKFKILHIITRLDKGGSAENTLLTTLGLDRNRYNVDIYCGMSQNPPSQKEEEALAIGVRIFRSPYLVRAVEFRKDITAAWQIFRQIRRERYDLVHTHTSKAGFIGRIAAFAAGVRAIVHTPHGHVFHGYFSPLKTRIFIQLERLCMRFTSILITLTETGKREHLAVGIGPASRITAVPSGIELKPFMGSNVTKAEARRALGIGEDRFVIGSIARLVSIKNHRLIVEAAPACVQKIPNILFVFVGDGPRRKELEERIAQLGLEQFVLFQGWKNSIETILPAFDLFAMPSLNEGMGRAFVEAQACGIPVIGSRVGGVPDVVQEGKTGLLIDPTKADDLAKAIVGLHANPQQRRQMSVSCKEWVDPRFGVQKMVSTIEGIYKLLLDDKTASLGKKGHQ